MRWAPSGATRAAAVVGSPIRHSLSPAIHNAAFAAAGLDWVFLAFDVPAGGGAAAVAGAAALGLAGLSVTMPLKDEVAGACDRLTPVAAALGAVNCVVTGPDGTVGDNTDGGGFLDALPPDWPVGGRRCAVVGAGGAARAIIRALAAAGAADVAVVNRTRARAETAAALAGERGRLGDAEDVAAADLVVNATSVGMAGTPGEGALPVDPAALRPGQLVADVVMHPVRTPLLAAAEACGAQTVDGIGMLVHQAARAFRLWTGVDPAIDAMTAAARAARDG